MENERGGNVVSTPAYEYSAQKHGRPDLSLSAIPESRNENSASKSHSTGYDMNIKRRDPNMDYKPSTV